MPTQLTTLANVEGWLNIQPGNTATDALLTRLITAASQWIENYLARTIGVGSYSRNFNGYGNHTLVLPQYPVISVASLSIDGQAIPVAANAQQNGYMFDDRAVYVFGYRFTRGFQNISCGWQAGYAAVPGDVEQACIHLVAARFRERDRIGEQSKVIQGMQVNFSIKDMPADVVSMLNFYKKVVPV